MSFQPDDWPRVKAVFDGALLLGAADREAYLVEACRGDAQLRQQVELLLASHERADSFLETPARALIGEPAGAAEAAGARVPPRLALSPGARLGPYEIRGVLGAGGMGEVYRAHDSRLHRDIALKILPDAFAADPERLARFAREARVLASLNHPHIGAIYGLEEADGVRALVLELVDGPTLADRIARGPLGGCWPPRNRFA